MSIMVQEIRKRLHKQNKNCIMIVVGPTGSGKSWWSNGFCLAVDPTFNASRIAHMKGSEFMRILRTKGIGRGKAIMWDDVGKGLKARDWQDIVNKTISDIMQTFRIRGLLVILNAPDTARIDSEVRRLFHYQIEMQTINRQEGYSKAKPFEIQVNTRTNKVYHKFPRITRDGQINVIKSIKVYKPPKELIRQYEKDKRKAYLSLEKESSKRIDKIEEKANRKNLNDFEMVADVIRDMSRFTRTYGKRTIIDQFLIMNEYDIGLPKAMKVKRLVERKLNLK